MKHFTILTLFLTLLLQLLSPLTALAAPAAGPSDPGELGAFLDGAIAAQMKADHVAGAVVTVVKDGQVLYTQGYGYADLEKQTPVDAQNTLFRIGSVSKLFIWTAVMQLVEQGKLSLEADVNTYLDFTIPATYSEPVTMRHLLTHTAGFEDSMRNAFALDADRLISLDTYLKTHIPARSFAPGTVMAYSNYGSAAAGYIVERISGMPFHAYVEKNILQPLGMDHSTFVQPLPEALAAGMSRGYNYSDGAYLAGVFELIPAYPAGAMTSTAADVARFMIAHLQNGQFENTRILSEATTRQMHSPLFSQNPSLHGMAYGFFEDEINGQRVISHGGSTLLFHSGLYLLPDQNVGIFISTNSVGGSNMQSAIFKVFLDRYYPVPERTASPVPVDFASRVGKYTGEYHTSRSNYSSMEKLFRLLSPFSVSVDRQGNVLVSTNVTTQYREVEPGRLVAEDGFIREVLMEEGPDGQIKMLSAAPYELIKTPWYATSKIQAVIFGGGLLLFLGTLVAWLVAGIFWMLRRRSQPAPPQPVGAVLARITAALFMLLFVVILLGLVGMLAPINPDFAAPRLLFETPPIMGAIVKLGPVMVALVVLALAFAVLAWVRRYWSIRARLLYTLLTIWFWVSVWAMSFWKLI